MPNDNDETEPEIEHAWLKGDEKPFGPSRFTYLNADIKYDGGLFFFAQGFSRSAEMLFDAISQGAYADSQYFALAFLWRQAIELQLKGMIEQLDQLSDVQRWSGPARQFSQKDQPGIAPPMTGHDLLRLWGAVAPQLREIFPDAPETDQIARAIKQFHAVDPGAEEFRYPTRLKDGSKTLSELPKVVKLSQLHEAMLGLFNMLEAASCEIGVRLDYKTEALSALLDR